MSNDEDTRQARNYSARFKKWLKAHRVSTKKQSEKADGSCIVIKEVMKEEKQKLIPEVVLSSSTSDEEAEIICTHEIILLIHNSLIGYSSERISFLASENVLIHFVRFLRHNNTSI